jgi:hypothetical protein
MNAYEQQQQSDYQRYLALCAKHRFQPMPFVLFQLGYQKKQ